MASKDVAPSSDALELAILGEGEYKAVVDDPEKTAREIAYRILNADSVESIFTQEATTSARDILGVALRVNGVRWNQSRMDGDGPTVFALIEAERLDNGKVALITCGSRNVMAQLFRAQQLGNFPLELPVKFQENETASGYGALWLVAA